MQAWFYHNLTLTCSPSSSDIGSAYSADQHALFHFAQRKNSAFQWTVRHSPGFWIYMENLSYILRHSRFFSCFSGFSSFGPLVSDSMTVLTPLYSTGTVSPSFDFLPPVLACSACSNPQPALPAHDPVILCPATMDAQWQQYYWNHYLTQQHHQQLTNPDTTTSPPTTTHHAYSPTGTYGPLTHALRTHHVHHSNPYVTPPYTPPSQHTPPPQAPTSQPTAGVSTSATATPAYGRTCHSTTIDIRTQPTATTHHTRQHSACPTTSTHPIPHTTCS